MKMKNFKIIIALLSFTLPCLISCDEEYNNNKAGLDFGTVRFKEPFTGILKSRPNILVESIKYPPYSWVIPDTLSFEKNAEIEVNEEYIRGNVRTKFALVDYNGQPYKKVKFWINNTPIEKYEFIPKQKNTRLKIKGIIDPSIGETDISGNLIVLSKGLDLINNKSVSTEKIVVMDWNIHQMISINWLLWFLWLLSILLIIALIVLLVIGLLKLLSYIFLLLKVSNLAQFHFNRNKLNNNRYHNREEKKEKKKKKNDNDDNPIIRKLLTLEKKLYSNLLICNKYDTLEEMRLILDSVYSSGNSTTYNKAKSYLKANTLDALEEAWKLWSPTPTSNVDWSGDRAQVCTLKSSHKTYKELEKIGFLSCTYDEHGSPNFEKVTYPGSIVNISDLYQNYSCEQLSKRGGGEKSFQEVAQKRIAESLAKEIKAWAKKNHCNPDFYKWRDAHDLVPHEDTNCRTMRLVYRTAHIAFKHRGGIANSINIKNHFSL